ncbi:hypothetical protein GCM10022215_16440 [Nocardioides fonticola]|uniref:Uncharacterized protein n=2 Tax=Nocardioides fonticola TaxID=450363 RepID=A0ABP7XI71_9ACTN
MALPSGSAFLLVRVFPWRVRPRVMKASTLRDADPMFDLTDVGGFLVGLGLWILILVAAPVLVVVFAALLLPVEVTLVVLLVPVVVLARLAGVVPWVIVIVDGAGHERVERTRNLLRVVRRVRAINGGGRVPVRWRWS